MSNVSKKIVYSDKAPKPIGPYSQAVQAGGFLFCSGQIALDAVSESAPGLKEQPEEVVYVTEPVPDPPVVVSLNGVP